MYNAAIMEPRVQYARTASGANIAFCETGEGRTVVRVPPFPWSHAQREWETFSYFLYVKPLANVCRIAWYDSRGSGLSDRDTVNCSMEALVEDLDTVLSKLGGDTFALCAISDGVPIAVSYAASRPERVSHLVLVDGYLKGSEFLDTPAGKLELGIRDKDWVLYTETLARLLWGFADASLGQRLAEHIRACCDPEMLRAAYDAVNDAWDIREVAPLVQAPTLVLHNESLPWLPVRAGQRLAAVIQNSRFVMIQDRTYEHIGGSVAEFLDLTVKDTRAETPPSGTAVILFTDIVDSTALTERMGDSAFRAKARDVDEAMRAAIRACDGTPVEGKLLGDGVLAVFTSARQAIAAAVRCVKATEESGLQLHLGLHAGDVIREADNVYGGAVNIAARIAAESAPGEILVSDTVRGLARTSADASFDDRGEHSLKGVAEPQRLFAVRTAG